jgi:hypothetical protein
VALTQIVGIYIRVPMREIERLRSHPEVLPKYDPRVALADGRAIDLGRAWEDLGVLLDGGVRLPDHGPTVGDIPLPETDSRAMWSYVEPATVAEIAERLAAHKKNFRTLYVVDGEDTDPHMLSARTGGYRDSNHYLMTKLATLAEHYAAAAASGEAMLVRIGERV